MVNCENCNKRVMFFQKNYLGNDKTKVYCKECKENIELQKQGIRLEKGRATCCVCKKNIDNRIFVVEGHNGYYCKDHIPIGLQRRKEEQDKTILQKKKEQEELDRKKKRIQNLVNKKGFKTASKIKFYTTYPLPLNELLLNEINNSYLVLEKGNKYTLNQSFIDFSNKVNLDLLSNYGFQVIKSVPSANKLIITPDTELDFIDNHPIYSIELYNKLDSKPSLINKKYCTRENFYSGLNVNDKISLFVIDYGSDIIVTTKDPETGEYNRQHKILDTYFISDNSYFILREIWVPHKHTKDVLSVFNKTAEEIVIEIKDKSISSSILNQLFEFLLNFPIEEKEIIWDRGNSYTPEKIKFEIKKKIPSNSENINENTIIKNYVPDLGIINIFVNNTDISVPYLCCEINKVESKPTLKNQKAIESYEELKSIVDLIGKISYYENKNEIMYFNKEFYFIFDKRTNKPKFR